MKKLICAMFAVGIFMVANASISQAVTYTPNFSDYAFPGTQYEVDAAANTYFYTNYGITIDHMYLYKDGRDTFDGIGVANGNLTELYNPATGRINFIDTTTYVTFEWLALQSTTYSAFNSSDSLLATMTVNDATGTNTFLGDISYLTVSGIGGFSTVSGLTYDYDGTTDGRNDDTAPVPEPSTFLLLGAGLAGIGYLRRRGRI